MPVSEPGVAAHDRRVGLLLLILGSALFLVLGYHYERAIGGWGLSDFKEVFYAARLAVHHGDPYQPAQLGAFWQKQAGNTAAGSSKELRQVVSLLTNLPTSLFLLVPIATLPWKLGSLLWLALTASAFILASFLIWRTGASYDSQISALLCFILLANSEALIITGNWTGLVVSFAAIAACCFLRERFEWAGVLCLGAALTVKPQEVGFVWLYFLLAGGNFRKRALQSVAVSAAIGILTLFWIHNASPHWNQELQSNMHIAFAHGGRDDLGPASEDPQLIICLQAIFSLVRDDPHFYNPASYLISGMLILIWALVTWRVRPSLRTACFALAAIAPLSMLPVYHRTGDATLLILAFPACAILWHERHPWRWIAFLFTMGTSLFMGDMPLHFLSKAIRTPGLVFQRALEISHPLALLILSVLFLWIYFTCTVEPNHVPGAAHSLSHVG